VKTNTYIEITASEYAWDKGTEIRILYNLPTDIDEIQSLRQSNLDITFVNDNDPVTGNVYYSIID
jgi:hypothetical protein